MFLLDASAWVALAKPGDEYREVVEALVDSPQPVAALDLTLFEVANVVGARMGKPQKARSLLRLIVKRSSDDLVKVDLELIDGAVAIAAEYGLTAYDAAYVAVARRYGWTLVSTDIRDLVSKGLAITPDAAVYP